MYPKLGEKVRVVGNWAGNRYDIVGVVTREGRRVRSGAVLGTILAQDGHVGNKNVAGKEVWVPWSVQYVTFTKVDSHAKD
jgi:hypothetical protein